MIFRLHWFGPICIHLYPTPLSQKQLSHFPRRSYEHRPEDRKRSGVAMTSAASMIHGFLLIVISWNFAVSSLHTYLCYFPSLLCIFGLCSVRQEHVSFKRSSISYVCLIFKAKTMELLLVFANNIKIKYWNSNKQTTSQHLIINEVYLSFSSEINFGFCNY